MSIRLQEPYAGGGRMEKARADGDVGPLRDQKGRRGPRNGASVMVKSTPLVREVIGASIVG